MSDPRRATCVRAGEAMSGAAALASVSATDGVPITLAEIVELGALDDVREVDEGMALVIGRLLGYETVAMEGGYEDLPDVRLPVLVALRDGDRVGYGVLHRFDESSAVVGDPRTGDVTRWSRERFCGAWTGSVVQVTPLEDERRALATRLIALRDPWTRTARAIGWTPPYGPRVTLLGAWLLVGALAWRAPRATALDGWLTVLVALACVTSLWSWLASEGCARCSRARQLGGGLPLAAAGSLLYGAMLATTTYAPDVPRVAIGIALAAAVGAHAALVLDLARAKIACVACLVVAALVAVASALWVAREDADPGPLGLVAAGALLAVSALLPWARARSARLGRATAEALARTVANEAHEGDLVRVIAFKRAGCSACAFFEAAVKPALAATFEEGVVIDERDLGDLPTSAPIVLVLGRRRALFIGLPAEDPIGAILMAIRAALEGEPAREELAIHDAA